MAALTIVAVARWHLASAVNHQGGVPRVGVPPVIILILDWDFPLQTIQLRGYPHGYGKPQVVIGNHPYERWKKYVSPPSVGQNFKFWEPWTHVLIQASLRLSLAMRKILPPKFLAVDHG